MRWDELTSDEFAAAVKETRGVCLMALGVMERHGPHLPLGTDTINGLAVCSAAAELEPAVVFPPWFLGQINEARCFPGAIAIPPAMLIDILLAMFDEIGRNGFTKIIAYMAHGGNNMLAPFLAQCQLFEAKPYQVYSYRYSAGMTDEERAEWTAALTHPEGGHAGESETSVTMANVPDLVKLDAARQVKGDRLGRMDHVRAGLNGLWWYADYPENIAGDPSASTAETGRKLQGIQARAMARFIRAVKDDEVTPALAAEFFQREQELRC